MISQVLPFRLLALPVFVLISSAAAASDATLELLAQKGIITADEYARLKAGQDDDARVSLKDGLRITSGDGRSSVQFGALLQMDAAHFDGGSVGGVARDYGDGSEFRRARLSMAGRSGAWDFRLETELSPNATSGITDAWAAWRGPVTVTAGNFKIPYSLESLMSDKNLAFMERSLSSAFMPSRAPGLMVSKGYGHGSLSAGVFGEPLSTATTDDEGGGFSARATWAPFVSNGHALHVGGSLHWRQPTQVSTGTTLETAQFSTRPEMNLMPDRLIDTGKIAGDVRDTAVAALELAATRGPLTAQAEYTRARVDRVTGGALDFDGGYVQLGWALTGEARAYKPETGILDGIRPAGKVAWEVAARLSGMNLSDGAVTGGRERNASAAVNAYVGPNVKLSLNYVDVLSVAGGAQAGNEPSAVMLRAQFSY